LRWGVPPSLDNLREERYEASGEVPTAKSVGRNGFRNVYSEASSRRTGFTPVR